MDKSTKNNSDRDVNAGSATNGDFRMEFSRRLKKSLNERTQTAVSKQLGCSQAVLSAYLSGDIPRSFPFLANLAKAYHVNLNWLFTGESALGNGIEIDRIRQADKRIYEAIFYGGGSILFSSKEAIKVNLLAMGNVDTIEDDQALLGLHWHIVKDRVRVGHIVIRLVVK